MQCNTVFRHSASQQRWEGIHVSWDVSKQNVTFSEASDTFSLNNNLKMLEQRIYKQFNAYEQVVTQHPDYGRLKNVKWAREWLENEGKQIINELHVTIELAKPSYYEAMYAIIRGAERLGDMTKERNMNELQNWDAVWRWTTDILLQLQKAFQRFAINAFPQVEYGNEDSIEKTDHYEFETETRRSHTELVAC